MKKMLLIIAILTAITGNSQSKSDSTKYKVNDEYFDSATFVENFGNIAQVGYQHQIRDKSSHKTLCMFIDAKAIWFYQLALYLGETDYNVTFDPSHDDKIIIVATPKAYFGTVAPKINAYALINKKGEISHVTIDGPADDLIKLYVGYWEYTDISLNELKTKMQVVKELLGDKITISWNGNNPEINITPNPHFLHFYASIK